MPVLAKRFQQNRHKRRGTVMPGGPAKPLPQEYMLIHPTAGPDMRGEFSGQRVYHRNGKPCVRLTARQARFYLDQGALQLVVTGNKADKPKPR